MKSAAFSFFLLQLLYIAIPTFAAFTESSIRRTLSPPSFECPSELGLPLGDLNFLVVTDIHGWIAGQHARHEPDMDVDFGALLSLYERLKECAPEDTDWYLLFNGDFMDGTGLSTIPPEYLAPLLQEMPFSALNVGNHELYFNEVIDYLMKDGGFVEHWDGNYLASNTDYIRHAGTHKEKMVPMGDRYTILEGPNTNSSALVFGFLFNFDGNANHSRVRTVGDTLEEDWFLDALNNESYDAIVVLAHMDVVDPLVYKILEAIRKEVGDDVPIHFFTGHTHHRGYELLDPFTASLEAGRYMDTIGFASITFGESNATEAFQYEQLEPNVAKLATEVLQNPHGTDFSTKKGRKLTKKLQDTEEDLGLLDVLTSCAPQNYSLPKSIDDPDSLWWLYLNRVIPKILLSKLEKENGENIPIFVQGTNALRYSLHGPVVVVDDVIEVTPFENPVYQVGSGLSAKQLIEIFEELHINELSDFKSKEYTSWELVKYGVAGDRPSKDEDSSDKYDLYTVRFHLKEVYPIVQGVSEDAHKPTHAKYKGESLETTKLWMEFISNEWKCNEEKYLPDSRLLADLVHSKLHVSETHLPVFKLATLSALLFLASLVFLARPKRRRNAPNRQAQVDMMPINEKKWLLQNDSRCSKECRDYDGLS